MKALHPADSEIKTIRGPGGVLPTLSVACDVVNTFSLPPDFKEFIVYQTANPLILASVIITKENPLTPPEQYLVTNSALGFPGIIPVNDNMGLAMRGQVRQLISKVKSMRVLSQSVTGSLVAPALSNQGTILSAQTNAVPRTVQPSFPDPENRWSYMRILNDIWLYSEAPNFEEMLMGTSAYTAEARDGFYQPLKLDKFKWRATRDTYWQSVDSAPADPTVSWNTQMYQGTWPINLGNITINDASMELIKPSCHAVGMTRLAGLSPDASLRIRFRNVVEMIPVLGKEYAPLAEAPYPPDDLAYKMVCEIFGRMKDAYPASYNDVGKLRQIIERIGKAVLKYADPVMDIISVLPGVGPFVPAVREVGKLTKAIAAARKEKKKKIKGRAPPPPPPPPPPQRKKLNIVRKAQK